MCILIVTLKVILCVYFHHRLTYSALSTNEDDKNRTLLIFTGRWKFLRVGLPYIYRDVRENGGVLDRVVFIMAQYDNKTYTKLKTFIAAANKLLKDKVFKMHDLPGFKPGQSPSSWLPYVHRCYDQIFRDLRENPNNQYLKADDDVLYYHPEAIKKIFINKNSSRCFIHFGNIAGANWRSSIAHQRMGLFNNSEINPDKVTFQYNKHANCGWKSPKCAEVSLRAFIHYYKKGKLDKYVFEGLELLSDRKRFSINFFLLDKDLIREEELRKVLPVSRDDEGWWTEKYSRMASIKEPNCIVGEALMVHFSYYTTVKQMLEREYLKEFEKISLLEVDQKMPNSLWNILEY